MKRVQKTVLFFLIIALCAQSLPAQANTAQEFNTDEFPQWAKDLRRWEIIAFGSIPFTMFTATFAMDMYRWNNANGMDFNDRRYAPWPLKSAGAVNMDSKDQELVFIAAASLSVLVAFADLIIVQAKRQKARKRAEAVPVGSTVINRKTVPADPDGQDGTINEAAPDTPDSEEPDA